MSKNLDSFMHKFNSGSFSDLDYENEDSLLLLDS